jgi:type I restriction enzyme S subunit
MDRLKPNLRFAEFYDSWYIKEVGQVLKIGSGKDYKHLRSGDIPVYGTGGLITYVDQYLHDGETVCIGRKGTIDKPFYHSGKLWTVDTLFFTHSFKDASPRFTSYLFQNINLKLYNEASGVPSLSKSTIEKIDISIPSLLEQEKIASFLSVIDDKIQLLNKKKSLLEKYKKGAMQQIFNQEIRFKDDDGIDFPDWEEKALGEMGNVIRGASPRPQGDSRYYGGNIPRLMVKDVTRDGKYVTPIIDFLTTEGAKLSRFCKAGTLTIVCSGTVGIPSFLAVDACIHDGFLALININTKYNDDYIYHNLTTLRDKFESSATHGGVFTNLTTTTIKGFQIDVPSLNEQTKIANFLSAIDDKINLINKQITQTQQYKKGLLQQMFV